MDLNTKQEILEVLTMPEETFWSQVAPAAREVCQKQFGTSLLVTAMLAYTNICKNQCLYCGMRAGNKIPRYRMSPEEILYELVSILTSTIYVLSSRARIMREKHPLSTTFLIL